MKKAMYRGQEVNVLIEEDGFYEIQFPNGTTMLVQEDELEFLPEVE